MITPVDINTGIKKPGINHVIKVQKCFLPGNCIFIVFLLFTVFISDLSAQTFEEARNLAFNGDRLKARQICKHILSQGFNSDVALLMGRTYAWDGYYDSARVVLNDVLIQKPGNEEALDALSDVEYWAENYEKAVEYCNLALKNDSAAEKFVLKKAKILHSNEKFDEAVFVLEEFIKKKPGNSEFIIKLKEYRPDAMKNSIRLSSTVDFFDEDFNRDPWQITAFSFGRKTKLGSVVARVNYANRFGEKGFQYEIDAWPKISENNYGYLNYGYSQASFFPDHRFGAELYHNFPKAFEGSIGMRLLSFSKSNVDIYTATIGKYVGNYWLSLRSYITPDSVGTSVSGALQARRYFSDPEDYLGIRIGYGISPDENLNRRIDSEQAISEKVLKLKTRSIRAEFNHIFNHIWILNVGAVLGNEELETGTYSGYYTFDISILRLF